MTERTWHELGPTEQFTDELPHAVTIHGKRLCVGLSGEIFFAMDDFCPHAGGSLSEGIIDGEEVICPLHAFGFHVKTGHCNDDPSSKVQVYPTRIKNGTVQVQL